MFRGFFSRYLILKIILLVVAVGLGFFVWQVAYYYRAITNGDVNGILEKQRQASFSKAVANTNVLPADLVKVNSSSAPSMGDGKAKLTIVEFLDYTCPYSLDSFGPMREAMAQYKDQVRFMIRDFPVEELHPRATPAALASHCAQEQGKFWAYHDKLFINPDQHEDADLIRYATEVGLDVPKFTACYQAQNYGPQVQNDLRDGLQVGVQGTPTFFFNGIKIQGALDKPTLDLLIKRFLNL